MMKQEIPELSLYLVHWFLRVWELPLEAAWHLKWNLQILPIAMERWERWKKSFYTVDFGSFFDTEKTTFASKSKTCRAWGGEQKAK